MKKKRIIIGLIIGILLLGATFGTMVAMDVFVKSYTVTFDVNGGNISEQTTIEVKKGATITLPDATKEGYSLNGWYNDKELWTENKKVTSNMTLTARWDIENYIITFIVGDKTYYECVSYGQTPEFTLGTPTIESTETEQYTFIGWEPSIVKATQSATYIAKFDTKVREYNLNLTTNLEDAGVITGGGKYEYSKDAEVSIVPNFGYKFLGWYFSDDTLYTTNTSFEINNINKDYSFIAKFEFIEKSITYNDYKNAPNSNITKYNVASGQIILQDLSLEGYNFIGWYNQEEEGDRITTINALNLEDVTLYARWELITYSITYNLNGGTNSAYNPLTYTIETITFTLYEPTKDGDSFVGWSGTDINSTTKEVVVPQGSIGNRTYNAVWTGGAKVITLIANGTELTKNKIIANSGDVISAPNINGADYGLVGYSVNRWKTSGGSEFVFNTMPNESITLYGEFEYFLGEGFLPYKEKFDTATSTSYYNPLAINSYTELVALLEYVCFYNKGNINFTLTYSSFTQEDLKEEMRSSIKDSKYPNLGTIGYSTYPDGKVGYFTLEDSGKTYEGDLLVADPTKAYTLDQPTYALSVSVKNKRANDFDNFKINKISKTLSVYSSNELVYALEIGVRPVPQSGSPAEVVYNKAKSILRNIVSDDMTDIEKARAIYEYISLNIQYDNYAVESASVMNSWVQYDSWQVEGALLNGVAVCDGISKAYLVLAKIENIPTIRIVSENHAWNKIYIDGFWYGVDSTHADSVDKSNNLEVFTYTQFMFTDSYKESLGQVGKNYTNLTSTKEYNYYDEVVITTTGGDEIDLYVTTVDEFLILLEHIKVSSALMEVYTFEIVYESEEYSTSYIYTILNATSFLRGTNTSDSGLTVYTYTVFSA